MFKDKFSLKDFLLGFIVAGIIAVAYHVWFSEHICDDCYDVNGCTNDFDDLFEDLEDEDEIESE